jgi:NAD(P)-dependent dehydrogenase (short-subunit alcohol dehydrogenase family)
VSLQLAGKVALVTGGGRGIGRAVSLALAAQGVSVALCGRTKETLDATAEEIREHGVDAWPIVADVTDHDALGRFVEQAANANSGGFDILVNNAVTSIGAPFDELTDEDWQYHLNVKLMAYIRGSRLALPFLRKSGGGSIVNIGGMTARISAPLRMSNGVVNAGVANFTKSFADFVAKDRVTVNCVHPGATATERMMKNVQRRASDAGVSIEEMTARTVSEIPLGRLIAPEDIAQSVMFFCSPMASMVTGQVIAVDGGSAPVINY